MTDLTDKEVTWKVRAQRKIGERGSVQTTCFSLPETITTVERWLTTHEEITITREGTTP